MKLLTYFYRESYNSIVEKNKKLLNKIGSLSVENNNLSNQIDKCQDKKLVAKLLELDQNEFPLCRIVKTKFDEKVIVAIKYKPSERVSDILMSSLNGCKYTNQTDIYVYGLNKNGLAFFYLQNFHYHFEIIYQKYALRQ